METPYTPARRCRISGCLRPHQRGGLCGRHRYRLRAYQDPHFSQWSVSDPRDVEHAADTGRLLPGMTRRERMLLAGALTARGRSAKEIAEMLQVSSRTVHRWRRREFSPAAR